MTRSLQAGRPRSSRPAGSSRTGPTSRPASSTSTCAACEAIARELGNALCAPVIAFVPEGDIDPPSGHMRYPGTISVREETCRMLLDDVASSLRAHGFTEIILIGDSGGNEGGLVATADALNARWKASGARALHIPEFYQ